MRSLGVAGAVRNLVTAQLGIRRPNADAPLFPPNNFVFRIGASIPFPPFGDVVRGMRKLLALFSVGTALFSALFSCSPVPLSTHSRSRSCSRSGLASLGLKRSRSLCNRGVENGGPCNPTRFAR
jgi:hypothetical protein